MTGGRLRLLANTILTSFWFTPFLMGIGGFLIALAVISYDATVADTGVWFLSWPIDPAVARAILGTIAGATISAASVVYSLSLLIRNLAASTLGPRLVENFRKNSITRVALGAQLAVFLYALAALFQIGFVDGLSAVSIIVAMVGVVCALSMLVIFVNAIADQVSVDRIVGRISGELRETIEWRMEQHRGEPAPSPEALDGAVVSAIASGYVQVLDYEGLAAREELAGLTVQLLVRPGDFVSPRQPLARLGTNAPSDDVRDGLRAAIVLGSDRTQEQDPIAQFDLLVEVALRALSPSLNDVFTAVACVHHLGAALAVLDGDALTAPVARSEATEVRPLAMPFAEVVNKTLHPLRHAGAAIPLFAATVLDVLKVLIATSGDAEARDLYRHHGRLLYADAVSRLHAEEDREALRARLDALDSVHGVPTDEAIDIFATDRVAAKSPG